ncbi:MAG: tetratricopeptide repeat protein [bacterium]|nr:tetratricopeptide repeat protein [bacterium]
MILATGIETRAVSQEGSADSLATTTQPVPTLRDAGDLYIEGYYARAVEQYEALAENPERKLAATLGMVRCRLMTGEVADAQRLLGAVEELGRGKAEWYTLAAEAEAVGGHYERAIEHARKAIALDKAQYQARHWLGVLLEILGRRADAIEAYRWFDRLVSHRFPETAEAATATAQGLHRYNLLTTHPNINDRTSYVLTELLQAAYTRMDRTCWAARIASGDLLRSKYNLEEAAEDYKAALRINTNLPAAQVGLGRVALARWDLDATERRVGLALKTNPGYVAALALRAEQKITERRYAEALEACTEALKTNPRALDVLALAAAAAQCSSLDSESAAFRARAERVNPRSATLHAILGDTLSGLRQYAEAEAHYLKAVEYDPTDANTRCALGMMYMQWGDEVKARAALEGAWALDEFNARTRFTLELLDSLASFATLETDHFELRYDREHESVLPRYMAAYLESIYAEVCADFDADLADKTIVEVFPTAKDFGVRITGKPWIFTVGACTGRVIALTSPRSDPQTSGAFNYARVLRHEFVHTVTLAATRNRIPHWYTEGLAVLQEDAPRSFAWCAALAERVRREELFTLESIDWGFVRPRRQNDRQVAYAQSEWMCEYLIERCGYDVLVRMLGGYRAGKTQEQVFEEHTGLTPTQFDADFQGWARRQAEGWCFRLDPPENVTKLRALVLLQASQAEVWGRLARAELDDDQPDKALEAARESLTLNEDEATALEVSVRVLSGFAEGNVGREARRALEDEMLPLLERLAKADPKGWIAPKIHSRILLRRDRHEEAIAHLKRLQRNCPLVPASYSGLAGIYLDRGEDDLALPQLLELARTEERDADVPAQIGAIYARRGELHEARYWYGQAMHIDPFRAALHAALANVLMRSGATRAATDEYLVMCELEPTAAHLSDTALALQKLGDLAKARDYAQKAVALDPAAPAGALLD